MKREQWNVIAIKTGKVIDTFNVQAFAHCHYWVKCGWAVVKRA